MNIFARFARIVIVLLGFKEISYFSVNKVLRKTKTKIARFAGNMLLGIQSSHCFGRWSSEEDKKCDWITSSFSKGDDGHVAVDGRCKRIRQYARFSMTDLVKRAVLWSTPRKHRPCKPESLPNMCELFEVIALYVYDVHIHWSLRYAVLWGIVPLPVQCKLPSNGSAMPCRFSADTPERFARVTSDSQRSDGIRTTGAWIPRSLRGCKPRTLDWDRVTSPTPTPETAR